MTLRCSRFFPRCLILLAVPLFVYFIGLPSQDPAIVETTHLAVQTRTLNSSILVLYWTRVFSHQVNVTDNPYEWPFLHVGNNCPINCEVSSNRSRIMEASALVIHARNADELPLSSKFAKSLPWILHVNENPTYTTSLHDEAFMGKFNFSATYRLDSDFPCPEFTPPQSTKPIPFAAKKGLVIAIYSHCETTRTLYMFRLMKHITVDSYGKCLRNRPSIPGGKNETKVAMRLYKFTLVFPNADCDYYMTEKIHNALSVGSVPVWMGTDKIDEVVQWGNLRHSVIKVGDFASPKELAEYLHHLAGNEREYNTYLKWKYEGFKFPVDYHKSAIAQWWGGLSLYCRVCMRIAKDPVGHRGLPVDRCDGKQRRTLEKWIRK